MQLFYQQELKQSVVQCSEQILSSIVSGSDRCNLDIKDLQLAVLSNRNCLNPKALKFACSANTPDNVSQSAHNNHRAPSLSRRKVSARRGMHPWKLDGLRADIRHLSIMLERLNSSQSLGFHIRSIGRNREELLLSLLLLRPQMQSATKALLVQNCQGISKTQLDWLGSEFDLLLSSVMQHRNDIDADDWTVSSTTSTSPVYHISNFYDGEWFTKAVSICKNKDRSKQRQKRTIIRIWRYESRVGRLDIQKTMPSSDNDIDGYENLGFTFMPFLDTPSTAVSVTFRKDALHTRTPHIQRQLHTYTVLPYRECRELYKLMEAGTICEIDDAFRSGRVSPYTLDFIGRSIHYVGDIFVYIYRTQETLIISVASSSSW